MCVFVLLYLCERKESEVEEDNHGDVIGPSADSCGGQGSALTATVGLLSLVRAVRLLRKQNAHYFMRLSNRPRYLCRNTRVR